MAKVSKTLLRTGVYSAPQGEFRADRARLERLVGTFQRMKAAGIRVPVSWGHSPFALPGDDHARASQQFWLGCHNAGYLPDLKLTPDGRFEASLDVPGCELDAQGDLVHWIKLPDGRQVRGKVGEVSVGVRPWRDGTGKDWGESLVHVALTPLPVAHGTGGFTATLSRSFDSAPGEGFTLSLTNMTRTLSAEAPVADDLMEDETPEAGAEIETEAEAPSESPPEGEGSAHFKSALEYLRGHGIAMPEDTTEQNFLERICVACHALENQAEEVTGEDLDGDGTVGGDDDLGLDDAPIEEQRPMMMSLSTVSDPATHAMLSREQEAHRKKLLKQIDALCARGLKPEGADALRAKAGEYTLSLDGEYNPAPKQLDLLLSLLDESLPARHPLKGLQTSGNGRARAARRPGPEDEGQARKRQEKVGDELAGLAGARAK